MTSPRTLLDTAANDNPRGLAGVAVVLGYSRPALSRYVNGSYGNAAKLEAAIVNRYDRRICPHTGEELAPEVCRRRALVPKPFGGAARERQWIACQTCPNRPSNEKSTEGKP